MHKINIHKHTTRFRSASALLLLPFLFMMLASTACARLAPLQKTRLLPAQHLIESGRYAEAKGLIESLISEEKPAQWARTWYMRGYLSHTAYREGMNKQDKKLYELYPDQLYLAYESYSKADSIDTRKRLHSKLFPKYIMLANDFTQLGMQQYQAGHYSPALQAYEQALLIRQNHLSQSSPDTGLLYNAALAAYGARDLDKAVHHFSSLHRLAHSANVCHLLALAAIESGRSPQAMQCLKEGIDRYDTAQQLVLLLSDLFLRQDAPDSALAVLDQAIARTPTQQVYHRTKGLIYQKLEDYDQAILAYHETLELDPEDMESCLHLATCYFNQGVALEDSARLLQNSALVRKEKEKSEAAFQQATYWLDRIAAGRTEDEAIIQQMLQLYQALRQNEKVKQILDQNR